MAYTVTKGSQIVVSFAKTLRIWSRSLNTLEMFYQQMFFCTPKISDCYPRSLIASAIPRPCSEPAWLDTLERCGSYHCTASQDGGLPLRRSSCRLSALWFRTAQTSSSCSGPPLTCSASARDTCMLPVGSQNTTMLFLQSLSLYILHTSRTVTSAHCTSMKILNSAEPKGNWKQKLLKL